MRKVSATLVKAFTKDIRAGNPAGVILEADGLTATQMQDIATELAFSESAFASSSDKADFRVRFFSPNEEVGFCGHATIATFHVLMQVGEIALAGHRDVTLTQETNIGILPVTCFKDGRIDMTQKEATFGIPEEDRKHIATLLGIGETALLKYPLQLVSTGTAKLIIPVDSLDTIRRITPDLPGIIKYCNSGEARGFYPFTAETVDPKADFHARQFNPAAGINEDPLTGVAAGALGCYAEHYALAKGSRFVVEQGIEMGKGGQMFVDVRDGVRVGGYATSFETRKLLVNDDK